MLLDPPAPAQRSRVPLAPPPNDPAAVRHAVRCTLLYSDLFEYPLHAAEVHRYLVDLAATPAEIEEALEQEVAEGFLERGAGFFFLAGRRQTIETRLRRQGVAERRWPTARRYGALIAALPFVRMVAVTGSLAMDNADPPEDIDYLIVTEPGRLWVARAFIIGLVYVARLCSRTTLCPNFLVTENQLALEPRDFFAAHEFAQMRPLTGHPVFRRLLRRNGWVADYLPNSFPSLVREAQHVTDADPSVQRQFEAPLRGRPGDWLEAWERERKLNKLWGRAAREGGRVAFSADECRGHFGGHEDRIAAAYRQRLARYSVPPPACLELGSKKQEAGSRSE